MTGICNESINYTTTIAFIYIIILGFLGCIVVIVYVIVMVASLHFPAGNHQCNFIDWKFKKLNGFLAE